MQCFTSPPTQYRLFGRQFLQVKRPNQQYQSTEGKSTKEKTQRTHHTQNQNSIFFSDSAKIEIVIFAESLLDLFWQQLLNVAELNDFIIFVVMSLCTLVEVVDLQHSAQ